MTRRGLLWLPALTAITILGANHLRAQGPRVGLVLSGGSAKALAHIGVLQVLADAGVRVDVVSGTSMGSLIGGLYAIGYTPAGIERALVAANLSSIFEDDPDVRYLGLERRNAASRTVLRLPLEGGRPTLPAGLLTVQHASELLAQLTWRAQTVRHFDSLAIPFAAVATDIGTGQPVVLDSGSLAEAIRASMALPTLFEPVEVNGRALVDGGLVRNLPASEAKARGADVLICSDVSSPLLQGDRIHSILDVLEQTMRFETAAAAADQRRLCDVYIQPDVSGLSELSFDQGPAWIARGDSAARSAMAALQRIARAQHPAGDPASAVVRLVGPSMERGDSVYVGAVHVAAPSVQAEQQVRQRIGLAVPAWLGPADLGAAVERVYSTGLFETVTYRLDATDSGTIAVVIATVATPAQIGVGVRYDNRGGAALLFSGEARSWLGYGTTTRVDVRLGDQFQMSAEHIHPQAFDAFSVGGTASYLSTAMAAPASVAGSFEDSPGALHIDIANATLFAGIPASSNGVGGLQLTLEHASGEQPSGITDIPAAPTYLTVAGVVHYDSYDRDVFPTSGTDLNARSEWAANGRFAEQSVSMAAAYPLTAGVSISGLASGGVATGDAALPLHYRFYLGGVTPTAILAETHFSFMGLMPEEQSGTSVGMVSGAVQDEVISRVYATLRGDVATLADARRPASAHSIAGLGLSIGTPTLLGPIALTASGSSVRHWPLFDVNLGVVF